MHINDLCSYKMKKNENKFGKIFRPWDSQAAKISLKDTAQDCTVSTTTKDEELSDDPVKSLKTEESDKMKLHVKKSASPYIYEEKLSTPKCCASKNSTILFNKCADNPHNTYLNNSPLYPRTCENVLSSPEMCLQTNPLITDYLQDTYGAINTDLVQTNLAHQLGLPPNDPLLMESLAQGYALEEYARVLTQEQQAKLLAAKKQRPKKYKCPHCDVGFSNNGQLKGHIRIHTGERPFKCDEKDCGKTFTRNEELTRHKRIHSGLRPFPCSHCGKRFGRKDHLKKHSRTHFQPRGLYAVPVVLPFEAWASGQTNGYPFFPVMY